MRLTPEYRLDIECLIAAVLIAALVACPAQAVVVLPKGAKQPIMGYLVRQDDRNVVVREALPGGKSRESSFAKKDLDELIITVSPQRLAALDPNKPQDYREYAEELAEKQRDPEARDAAIRLYAITAARGDEKLRHSALLGLIALAHTSEEERLFRATAYWFDPNHDPTVLTGPVTFDSQSTWSESIKTRGLAPLPALSLERLTEFDPAACVYRGGKWVRP